MIDYEKLEYHPLVEKLTNAVAERIGTNHHHFFRTHVSYYVNVIASMMRTSVDIPGSNLEPVSMYAINLAPSGFGKGYATTIIEESIISTFRRNFTELTLPALAAKNLPILASQRSNKKNTDYDEELEAVKKEFKDHGTILFCFDSATPPAVKQMRNMLLMAKAGSMNLQTDEIGANLTTNRDVMMLFLELFSGRVKNKLIKNTADSIRSEEIHGVTPTNMMLFGVAYSLLDGAKTEQEFISMLAQGFGRRCFFGFISDDSSEPLNLLSPLEQLKRARNIDKDSTLSDVASYLGTLSHPDNAHKILTVPDSTAEIYFQYKNDCAERAHKLPDNEEIMRAETKQRYYKAMKLAGAYAFIDGTSEVTPRQFLAAIKLSEDSGKALKKIIKRERDYVRLAKYLATHKEDITQADLIEDLPFYTGTKGTKLEMMAHAVAWGYKNNILIKRKVNDHIEFFSGEALEETDLNKIIISYSGSIADQYVNEYAPFHLLHNLTQLDNRHWINHHSVNGRRHEDHLKKGFNTITLDVDGGTPMHVAKELFSNYQALYYTTKRHTEETNRYRIIIPTNYTLKMEAEEYKVFMKSIIEWLPVDMILDDQTGQRSRKWLTHNGEYSYTEGKLFDVLPFIPRTSKNDEFIKGLESIGSMDSLERWFYMNSGKRNNMLIQYALMLVDTGYSLSDIQVKVFEMNSKLPDSLPPAEIENTIFKTVGKKIRNK